MQYKLYIPYFKYYLTYNKDNVYTYYNMKCFYIS